MSKATIGFIISSLIYLAISTLLGVLMAINYSEYARLTGTHVHIGLLGFLGMIVYGVGYHILPRFRGRPLHSESLAMAHLWLGNITLIGMAFYFPSMAYFSPDWNTAKILFVIFGAGHSISILMCVYNLLFTLLPLTPVELPPALVQAKARIEAQKKKAEE
ncbi:MAG: hypothetical protein GTO55_06655 [Armatimonadetes bacterium]|nr:hypothetical protein [Armatimonadota bacterium]NIM23962.1 hypothetical protein [Armatimonadota bacterium]NIM67809.1 hypothetical protein [Armatimonadota bacterium]NIM76349.1 hypothetical protein [Armatimonadota bacterium]NIN06043.1 hypothetical protein [Armatimonadota bacterium]